MTNETSGYLVLALARRLTYLSGAPYQGTYCGKDSVAGIPGRIATSLALAQGANGRAFGDLRNAGDNWAWIALDGTPLRSWERYVQVKYQNEAVALARLDSERCP